MGWQRISARLLAAAAGALVVAGAALAGDRAYPSASEVEPLAPGARVPSVRVEGVRGEPVDLSDLARDAGALLVFFRGGW